MNKLTRIGDIQVGDRFKFNITPSSTYEKISVSRIRNIKTNENFAIDEAVGKSDILVVGRNEKSFDMKSFLEKL